MPVQYDENIIHECADKLYSSASRAVGGCIFIGILIGAIIGSIKSADFAIIGIIIGLIIGWFYGAHKAFQYRIQAQVLLCQAQIEKNTR